MTVQMTQEAKMAIGRFLFTEGRPDDMNIDYEIIHNNDFV
jgi:hypothetical protein